MASGGKKCRVIVSDEATQMLISHARFLAQVSETAAQHLITEFEKRRNHWRIFRNAIHGFLIRWCRQVNTANF